MKSAIYEGTVGHFRHVPRIHRFCYPIFMMYLDLAELPELFDPIPLWSARRAAPAWFRRADYLGEEDSPLAESVRRRVAEVTGKRPEGPIRMLTHLRTFGFCFNPVTFYYCFSIEGGEVEAIVAEITNTPWGERHSYVLEGPTGASSEQELIYELDKDFHVSPFMDMDQRYVWRFFVPGPRLEVRMENHAEGRRIFDARLVLERQELDRRSALRVLARHPLLPVQVLFKIYRQAASLWLGGVPFFPHPKNLPNIASRAGARRSIP